MRRLSIVLSDPPLAESAASAAHASEVPASRLAAPETPGAAPLGDVLLTDLKNLRSLADRVALPLVWLVVSHASDLFEVPAECSAAIVGLIRVDHVAEDIADAIELLAPRPPVCRDAQQLQPELVRLDTCHALPNRRELAFAAARTLRGLLEDHAGADAATALRAAAAVLEAIDNAMFRGNLELSPALRQTGAAKAYVVLREQRQRQTPYRDRRVWVTSRITPQGLQATVRDEGPGFDVPALCAQGLDGHSHPRAGRGSLVMRQFCSDVRYNDAGNEVTLILPLAGATSLPSEWSSAVSASNSVS
jgi:hypothetical protein